MMIDVDDKHERPVIDSHKLHFISYFAIAKTDKNST